MGRPKARAKSKPPHYFVCNGGPWDGQLASFKWSTRDPGPQRTITFADGVYRFDPRLEQFEWMAAK